MQVTGPSREVIDAATLDRMTDSMTHRGPNDRGTHLRPGIALGARRLSIVDVAGGHQPVFNEDGAIVAAQNGELYNHAPIRDDLERKGHRFGSRCDTEIIPHLFEEAGTAFPEQLRGKFAVAAWDAERRRGVVARDRLGVKPLYYAHIGDLVIFGSELKSVLASGLVSPDLDYDALDAYLSLGYIPAPRTPLAQVSKLPPGHRLIVDGGTVTVEPYWSFPAPNDDSPGRTEEEWTEGLLEKLEEAVRLRLMSDVPLGAMLSGGLDSSLIVGLMARNMTSPVKTFSVGFVEDADHNELADAREVAAFFGAEHHELELSFAERQVDLADLVWHLDEPIADLSALGFLALSELAARNVTVALSGQGADELLGGYRKHRAAKLLGPLRHLPRPLRAGAPVLTDRGPSMMRRAGRALAADGWVERQLAMSGLVDDAERARLVRGPLASRSGEAGRMIGRIAEGLTADPLDGTLYLDSQLALVDDMLHYFDRTSMAHSLEVRVPFLDHELVEYCAGIPARLKVHGLTTKYVLKRAARGIVPDRIIEKRKLGFFRGASDGWLRSQMDREIRDYLLDPAARTRELVDRTELERLLAAHQAGTDVSHVNLLLALLMLEVWLSTYLDRAFPATAAAAPLATA